MRCLFAAAVLGIATFAGAAHADTVRFTESANATGSLNGIAFTNAPLIISGSYDPLKIRVSTINSYNEYEADTPLTYQIAGFGSAISLASDLVFLNTQYNLFGTLTHYGSGNNVLVATSSEFFKYGLNSSFGPVTGPGTSGSTDGTSAGPLSIASTGPVTVTETLTVTPEPSSLLLLATGVLSVGGMVRRRLSSR